MEKIDFKKKFKDLYNPSKKDISVVDVPPMNFVMFDGKGDPGKTPEFQKGVEALYTVAYTLKFMLKKRGGRPDYTVPPCEGLWWAGDMTAFSANRRCEWKWTIMIMQPDFVTKALIDEAVAEAKKKKDLPALAKVRFERFAEGKCVQIMHVGPYADEWPTIERMHRFIAEHGWQLRGKHHEIYLSDPRKTAPEKLKTVIRHPFI
jgi:hypothetical protein